MPVGGAIQFLFERVGGAFDSPHQTLTVPVAGVRLFSASGDRFQMSIVNNGSFPIRVQVDELDTTAGGWDLAAGGSILAFDIQNDWVMPTFAFYAFGLGGASTAFIQECVRFHQSQ